MDAVTKGIIIGLIGFGLQIDNVQHIEENKLYISIPEKIENLNIPIEEVPIKFKEALRELCHNDDLKVFCKVRKGDIWTEEKGIKASEDFINDYYDHKTWGLFI